LEDRGLLASEWGMSDNNRRAKFYRLTAKGHKELAAATNRWRCMTRAIGLILGESKT
jgi:DNA-binding PadR family transcriptional regulator